MTRLSLNTNVVWPSGRVRLQDFVPPLRDWRFWLIQVLILVIAAIHTAADEWNILRPLGIPDFVPVSLFLVPVIFASLRFGLPGAISTATWVVILLLPDMLYIDVQLNRWADGTQLALICAMSIFVGYWVQKERRARYQAEQAQEAHRAAEARYRALFESNHAPILVVDSQGTVRDSNPAAQQLFDVLARKASATLADCLGSEDACNILQHSAPEVIRVASGAERLFRPIYTNVTGMDGNLQQIVLEDVTEERRRRQQMQSYAAFVLQGQEEERSRIAHELHDEPVQAVIHLCRQLDIILATNGLPDAVVSRMHQTRDVAEGVVSNLRELARGLRPPSLDDLGLATAVRRMLADSADRNGYAARFRTAGQERRLRPEVELGLFRVMQEALHNVERHAAAQHVYLSIVYSGEWVGAALYDDGIGIAQTPVAVGSSGGLGLVGMRERTELMDGCLVIRSQPGQGTFVRVAVPAPH
ncbi:MAG TPA: ATP-binding protein [Anaerolineae bacterium]